MGMTFQEQQTFLSSHLGDSDTDTDSMFPLAQRKLFLNRGEKAFARDTLLLKDYATGTVADKQLAMPSYWIRNYHLVVNDFVIDNEYEIDIADWERYYNWGGDRPYYYMWDFSGTKYMKFIGGSSVNGKTYYLWYFRLPSSDLVNDNDESPYPDDLREASTYWAASRLLKQIGKTEQSADFMAEYVGYVVKGREISGAEMIDKGRVFPDFGEDTDDYSGTDRQGVDYRGI